LARYDLNYAYKRQRDRLSRLLNRLESLPDDVFEGGTVSDRAKRKLFEEGIPGRAHILKAPSKYAVSEIQYNVGTFRVRVEVEGRPPYETKVKQSFAYAEWLDLQKGAVVDCKVDPTDPRKVMLMVAEGELEQGPPRLLSAAATVAAGRPATGTVVSAEPWGQKSPGTDDDIYVIDLELRADDEPRPWRITLHQRVPRGAEGLVVPGAKLSVAYGRRKDDPGTTAIDWPGSTGGRFT
jgi:hypothetical protein